MVSSRENMIDVWATFSLLGVLIPVLAMLAFGWADLETRVRGMVAYSTVCLPGFAFAVSVLGDQVESGRGLSRPDEGTIVFAGGAILFFFVGVSATGIIELDKAKNYTVGVLSFFLLAQLAATIIVILASARIKSSLTRR